MPITKEADRERQRRVLRLYCTEALWKALHKMAVAQGTTRGKALRRLMDEMTPQLDVLGVAMLEAALGRQQAARDRLAGILGHSLIDLAAFQSGGYGAAVPPHAERSDPGLFGAVDAAEAEALLRHPVDQRRPARR